MVEVRGGRAYPILWSAGQPVRPGPLSFHRKQPLASNAVQTKPAWSRSVGANEPAHPPLAASGPYLPSLSLAPSARHYLRQEPYAGNPPVRIRAGGTEQSVSLPRHKFFRCKAPFLLRREIECRITPSIPAQNPWTPPRLQAPLATTPPHHLQGQARADHAPIVFGIRVSIKTRSRCGCGRRKHGVLRWNIQPMAIGIPSGIARAFDGKWMRQVVLAIRQSLQVENPVAAGAIEIVA